MAQDPLTDELVKRAVANAPAMLQPPQANGNGTIDRMMQSLRKVYPDVGNMDVKTRDMGDPMAFGNILGQTGDHEDVTVHPLMTALGGEAPILDTLAHELQHVRQNRAGVKYEWGPDDNVYLGSPQEKDAFAEQERFQKQRPPTPPVPREVDQLWRNTVKGDTALDVWKKKLQEQVEAILNNHPEPLPPKKF